MNMDVLWLLNSFQLRLETGPGCSRWWDFNHVSWLRQDPHNGEVWLPLAKYCGRERMMLKCLQWKRMKLPWPVVWTMRSLCSLDSNFMHSLADYYILKYALFLKWPWHARPLFCRLFSKLMCKEFIGLGHILKADCIVFKFCNFGNTIRNSDLMLWLMDRLWIFHRQCWYNWDALDLNSGVGF